MYGAWLCQVKILFWYRILLFLTELMRKIAKILFLIIYLFKLTRVNGLLLWGHPVQERQLY